MSSGCLHSGNSTSFNCNSCSKMFGTSSSGSGYDFCSRSLKVRRRTSFFCYPSSYFLFAFASLFGTLIMAVLTIIESLRLPFAFLTFIFTSFLLSSSIGGFVFPWLEILNSM
ncbi:hypothetical protein ACJW31_02G024900 [Castanea mollissima]